jgi:hypothetical protein
MANSTWSINLNPAALKQAGPRSATTALLCSCLATLIMAFLILFGILQSCSRANILIFLVLFGISVALVICGIIAEAISYRKTKSRLAIFSLLFAILYTALLVFLIKLMSY